MHVSNAVAVRAGVKVPNFGKLTVSLELACIPWRIYWPIATGAKLHSGRWDMRKYSAMLGIMVWQDIHTIYPQLDLMILIVSINTPNGPAPPLITGTFGGEFISLSFRAQISNRFVVGADFIHSLMGEATEYASPYLLH